MTNSAEVESWTELKHLGLDGDDNVVSTASKDKLLVNQFLAGSSERSEDRRLLAAIQRLCTSKHSSDQVFGYSALTELQEKWIQDTITPNEALELLIGPVTDSSLQTFFRHDLASPWLSYVSLCWRLEKDDFTEEHLFRFFKRANLNVEAMEVVLRSAANGDKAIYRMLTYALTRSSTRALAFRLLNMHQRDIKHLWQFRWIFFMSELDVSPLNVWLEFVAFQLSHTKNQDRAQFLNTGAIVWHNLSYMKVYTRHQKNLFNQIINDMEGKEVTSTLYGSFELDPFANWADPAETRQRNENLENLARHMIVHLDGPTPY